MNENFAQILKRITPVLRRIAFKVNRRHTFFNEEDLYQEALVYLWQAFNAGKLKDKTDSYILQGCYFHLKNYLRKAKVRPGVLSLEALVNGEDGLELEEVLSLPGEGKKEYLDYLNSRMVADVIRNNGLTDREKNILFMYADGLTTRQIGKRFGVSHVSIVKQLAVIREKCIKHLD